MSAVAPPSTKTPTSAMFGSPKRWALENLFSSPFNTLLTILTSAFALVVIRGVLSFVLSPERKWGSVTENMRLYMVLGYPAEEILRVWISLGLIVSLAALSIAAWNEGRRVTASAVARPVAGFGFLVLLGSLVAPEIAPQARLVGLGVGVVALLAAVALRRAVNSTESGTISIVSVIGGLAVLLLIILWTIRVPVPVEQVDAGLIHVFEPLARSTTVPWSMVLAGGFVAFGFGTVIRSRMTQPTLKRILSAAWILSYPLVVFVILRKPLVQVDLALRHLGIGVALAVAGGAVLYGMALAFPDRGRMRAVALVLAAASLGSLFTSIESIISTPLVLFALFAVAAPSFATSSTAAKRVAIAWAASVLILVFFMSAMAMELGIFSGRKTFLGGLMLTVILAIGGVLPGFILSIPLALGRMSKMPIVRQVCIAYIEVVRAVPLIVWLFMGVNLLALFVPAGFDPNVILRVVVVFTFFWAAYLAENVRGGLQAIPKGQVEAAQAIGLTPTQATVLIVLPQALRVVIPPIVGQVITSFKDTSLVTVIGVSELLNIAQSVPKQTVPFNFSLTQEENFLFVAAMYFLFTFSLSKGSQRLERKLGVGER